MGGAGGGGGGAVVEREGSGRVTARFNGGQAGAVGGCWRGFQQKGGRPTHARASVAVPGTRRPAAVVVGRGHKGMRQLCGIRPSITLLQSNPPEFGLNLR